nr:cytochrome c3 family protein [Desulfobulbaceae bacterium]
MKRLSLLCSIVVLLTATAVQAAVLDAPHNETNGITCNSCHSYSLWWQYSPAEQHSAPNYAGISTAVCNQCHGDADTYAAHIHSKASTNPASSYLWANDANCVDCHDPHEQEQLYWKNDAAAPEDPFLVTGVVSAGGINVVGNTTEITFDGTALVNLRGTWPMDDVDPLAVDWTNKNNTTDSRTTPPRSLVLVHDTTLIANTYPIISVVDGGAISTVTVAGIIDPVEVGTSCTYDPSCSSSSSSFGLIYGQLIRKQVNGKSVKFFDGQGGFVDTAYTPVTDPATGICQVCHVQTKYWTNDGTGDDSVPDVANHNTAKNCTNCHIHSDGFTAQGHDATHFAYADISYTGMAGATKIIGCSVCHSSASGPIGLHATCGICHQDSSGSGVLRIAGDLDPAVQVDPLLGIDGDPNGEYNATHTYASTCNDCHNVTVKTNIENNLPNIHHIESANNYAANGNCTACHKDEQDNGLAAADHSTFITLGTIPGTVTSCETADCHEGVNSPVSANALGARIDPSNPQVHDACTTCHTNTGALKVFADIAVANQYRVKDPMATATGLAHGCLDCHNAS